MTKDPYEEFLLKEKFQKNMLTSNYTSKLGKKWEKLKVRAHGAQMNIINGSIMGFLVGALFGFFVGCVSAFQSRRLISIPLSVLASGSFFGFIMGIGSALRTSEQGQLSEGDGETVLQANMYYRKDKNVE